MPQISHAFAVGRVSALSNNLISQATIERVAAATTIAEVGRMLTDAGWGDAQNHQSIDALTDRHVVDACRLIHSITPEPGVTECFLLKYDVLNLKLLLKARMLGIHDVQLSPCGTINPEKLRHAFAEANYSRLPEEMKAAIVLIERKNAIKPDPLMADAELDKALYRMIAARLHCARDRQVIRYFTESAELANLMIALRAHAMKRGGTFAARLLVEGGSLSTAKLIRVADGLLRPEELIKFKPYLRALKPGLDLYAKTGALAPLEKRIDDYLMSIIRGHRHDVDGILPLIGYLVAREREAASVRLIMAAKASKLSQDRLMERLRELYV